MGADSRAEQYACTLIVYSGCCPSCTQSAADAEAIQRRGQEYETGLEGLCARTRRVAPCCKDYTKIIMAVCAKGRNHDKEDEEGAEKAQQVEEMPLGTVTVDCVHEIIDRNLSV